MLDKISGLVLNEIQLSKEFEEFIKEKYPIKSINADPSPKNDTNNNCFHIKKIKTNQTKENKENFELSNNFLSIRSLNEMSVENFIDVIAPKDTKNVKLGDCNFDDVLREKIEFLKTAKNENFADKERKYLEVIEKLLASIKEIQEEKGQKEFIVNNNNNNKNHLSVNKKPNNSIVSVNDENDNEKGNYLN